MLTQYLTQTRRLLQNPSAPTTLYSDSDLTNYINIARGQLAGESQAIRVMGTLSTGVNQRNYNFSAITLGTSGVAGVIHVRRILYAVGGGYRWMRPRNWPWFDLYKLNNPVPKSGPPEVWAQYGQGAAGVSITAGGSGTVATGSIYIDPLPDIAYTLSLDCVCYPNALVADSDAEAIPYLWTDAVPFFAAYYALLSSQTSARMADAERYLGYYKMFTDRARKAATPDVNKYLYEQVPDPTIANQLGLAPQQRQGQQ